MTKMFIRIKLLFIFMCSQDIVSVKKEVASVASLAPEKSCSAIEGTANDVTVGSIVSTTGASNQSIIKTANGVNLNGHIGTTSGGQNPLGQV